MPTAQSLFDQVTEHLFKQGVAAISPENGTCQYRTSEGLMCAVGCLLDDDTYQSKFESKTIKSLVMENRQNVPEFFLEHTDLLYALQSVHDNYMPRFKVTPDSDPMDIDLYDMEMRVIARKLRECAAVYQLTEIHKLTVNENLIPEQYRDAG